MKRYLACSLVMALLLIGLLFSPFGIAPAMSKLEDKAHVDNRIENYKRNEQTLRDGLANTISQYQAERTYEVDYTDVAGLLEVFRGMPGVDVYSVDAVDPYNDFVVVGEYVEGTNANAVSLSITAENADSVVSTLKTMDLPVQSIIISYPSDIIVTFMIGGVV